FGMIPIDQLLALTKMERSLVPNPGCSVPQHKGILRLLPTTAVRLSPSLFSQEVGSTQMGHIAVEDGARYLHDLACRLVLDRCHGNVEEYPDLHFFPSLLADIDTGAIH